MRRVSIVIAICFVFALALSVMGQAPGARTLDTIMKEIGPVWQGAQGAPGIGGRGGALDSGGTDTAKIAADAAKLQPLFMEAQAEFNKLKMTEAAGMAKAAADAAGNLAKEAKTGKIADSKAAKASISCGGCHMKFRESDGAGGFKVKAQ